MSADCLAFYKNKNNEFVIVDDDTTFLFKKKKTALNLLKNVCKSQKLNKKINFENLKFFYKNYSTNYIKFQYIDDNMIQEIKNQK